MQNRKIQQISILFQDGVRDKPKIYVALLFVAPMQMYRSGPHYSINDYILCLVLCT